MREDKVKKSSVFWDENHEEKIESKEPKSQVPKKHAQST
jgi:hypothetical protein